MCVCLPCSILSWRNNKYLHRYKHTGKLSFARAGILTKTCLQMMGIDPFNGAEQHWRLFEWKSAPSNRHCLPATPTWAPRLLLACCFYWRTQTHALISPPSRKCWKLLIACVLVAGVIWETSRRAVNFFRTLFKELQGESAQTRNMSLIEKILGVF